jgi:hypothetical protein
VPVYDFVCPAGHKTEKLVQSRDKQIDWCACGRPSERQSVYMIGFGMDLRTAQSQSLQAYYDSARELEYQAKRSDDPGVLAAVEPIAHAAKVRAQGQMLAGHETWRPDKVWNQKEPE